MSYQHWIMRIAGVAEEVAILETPEARAAAMKVVEERVSKNRRYKLLDFGCYGVCFMLGMTLTFAYTGWMSVFFTWIPRTRRLEFGLGLSCMMLFATLGFFAPIVLSRARARRVAREYLNVHGFTLCMHCGYDRRGAAEPRCPECGKAFERVRDGATNDS